MENGGEWEDAFPKLEFPVTVLCFDRVTPEYLYRNRSYVSLQGDILLASFFLPSKYG